MDIDPYEMKDNLLIWARCLRSDYASKGAQTYSSVFRDVGEILESNDDVMFYLDGPEADGVARAVLLAWSLEKDRLDGNDRENLLSLGLDGAVMSRNLGLVEKIVEAGCGLEKKRFQADTPLVMAARDGWSKGVEFLLDKKAKVDSRGRNRETAAMAAAANADEAMLAKLLGSGADATLLDAQGRSALGHVPDLQSHESPQGPRGLAIDSCKAMLLACETKNSLQKDIVAVVANARGVPKV